MAESLVLDSSIRDWILIPIMAVMILTGISASSHCNSDVAAKYFGLGVNPRNASILKIF